MDADAIRVVAEVLLALVTLVFGGGYLHERRRGRSNAGALGEAAAEQSMLTRGEAEAMVRESERLGRIEHNTATILQQQQAHAQADEKRFDEHGRRLEEAEWRLHKHGSAIMAQGATLDTTRENLGLATSPGTEPGERWRRMVEEPRKGRRRD